jgi:hypothetical protein
VTAADAVNLLIALVKGATASSVFILALFIGFCVVVGFTKLKRTAGNAPVIRSLDERLTHQPMTYLPPDAPRGPADQLKAPELVEAAARKS